MANRFGNGLDYVFDSGWFGVLAKTTGAIAIIAAMAVPLLIDWERASASGKSPLLAVIMTVVGVGVWLVLMLVAVALAAALAAILGLSGSSAEKE